MVRFGDRWAHAHDAQQDAFMRLAAMFAAANPFYRDHPWFGDWWREWLTVAGNQGNGLSDALLNEHLTDNERVEVFRNFLREYRVWVAVVGPVVEWEFRIDSAKVIAHAELIEAVVRGDDQSRRPQGNAG
jgi:hypothetical protein